MTCSSCSSCGNKMSGGYCSSCSMLGGKRHQRKQTRKNQKGGVMDWLFGKNSTTSSDSNTNASTNNVSNSVTQGLNAAKMSFMQTSDKLKKSLGYSGGKRKKTKKSWWGGQTLATNSQPVSNVKTAEPSYWENANGPKVTPDWYKSKGGKIRKTMKKYKRKHL